jgi:hypothetical protein
MRGFLQLYSAELPLARRAPAGALPPSPIRNMKNKNINPEQKVTTAAGVPDKSWYSVRSIFRSELMEDGKPRRAFEERVVLISATDCEEALAKGEAEAKRYVSQSQHRRCKLLRHFVSFSIHDGDLCEGDEVWSCIRDLNITDKQFLRQIYDGEFFSFTNARWVRRRAKRVAKGPPIRAVVRKRTKVKVLSPESCMGFDEKYDKYDRP